MDASYNIAVKMSMLWTGFNQIPAMVTQLATLQERLAKASATAGGFNRSIGLVAAGLAALGAGAIGAKILGGWISSASQLQLALTGVGLATSATGKQLEQFRSQAYDLASSTLFSAPQILDFAKKAATSGLNNASVLYNAMPGLARLAEVAYRVKGSDPGSAIEAAIQAAHLFQSYPTTAKQTAGFNKLIDLMGRAQMVAGGDLQSFTRTLTYLAPLRAGLGVSVQDMVSLAAEASNVGLAAGKGGASRIAALFREIIPTGSAKHDKALARLLQLGGGQMFHNGQFVGAPEAFNLIMKALSRIPDHAARLRALSEVFLSAGSTAASTLASPGAVDRFKQIQQLLGPTGLAPTAQMQNVYNATAAGQWESFRSTLGSISSLLGTQLLPAATAIASVLNRIAVTTMKWLEAHPKIAQFIATFTAVATAAALISGPVLIAAGAFGILTAAGITANIAFLPFTAIIFGIVAAVSAVTLIFMHWGDITQWLGKTWGDFYNGFLKPSLALFGVVASGVGGAVKAFLNWADAGNGLTKALSPLTTLIGAIISPVAQAVGWFLKWSDASTQLGNLFSWMGTKLHDFLVMLGILHNGPHKTLPSGDGSSNTLVPKSTYKPGEVQSTQTIGGTVGTKQPPITVQITPAPHGHVRPGLGGGGMSIQIHNHINGHDHQTAQSLAESIAALTLAKLEAMFSHGDYWDGTGVFGLEVGRGGY